jgi:(p)ppGpp synthase/HD superfamily hydrolase
MPKIFTFTDALIMAAEAHRGQKDGGGIDYIKHPLHIATKLKQKGYSNPTQIAGLLHDCIEDTDLNIQDLIGAGCPDDIIEALKLLTHVRDQEFVDKRKQEYIDKGMAPKLSNRRAKDDEYFEYIKRIAKNDIARAVKIEDLRHNGDIRRAPDDVYENEYTWNRWAKYALALKMLTGYKVGYC